MASAGWYPDPGGAPGRFRYWDGTTWAAATSPTPSGPPDGGDTTGGPPGRGPRRAPWIGAAVLVVVLALVIAVIVRGSGGRTPVDSPPALPGPSTSTAAGNDPSPGDAETASAPPSETPTPAPGATQVPSATFPCPVGDPGARQPHRNDGRTHGGGLAIPAQSGWTAQDDQVYDFSWAYDVGVTGPASGPSATYAVGAVSVADGFETPKVAAQLSMRCTLGLRYRSARSHQLVRSQAATVAGHPAWVVESRVEKQVDQETYVPVVVRIVVVDLGAPESLAFFWGDAPADDPALVSRLDQTSSRLTAG